MQFQIEKAIVTKVTPSKKEPTTCFLEVHAHSAGRFDIMVTNCNPAELAQIQLVPVSLGGVLIGSVYSGQGGSVQRLRCEALHIGKVNGKG